jgi:hypothetical protein
MVMSGIPFTKVAKVLDEAGAQLIRAGQDESAGPDWVSHLYIAVKLPAASREGQPYPTFYLSL